ncbi:hypothetical protein CFS9_11900 [Flavobacterium sp. CFS9]|mgnify:FL=1|jgi:hypothetical protein|uniref:Uncharacterized protein n=3 Tax=Flavobacterium TaxID=237 RepID=A0A1S1JBM4_9FLAO|nr:MULTISPECIES: hypothetical protein [Flavobacterium]MCC9017411.1 hypothetical protein [Flavobacterium sp. F-126]MDL2143815.1 hypothetical protein [Flavobacterium tructae]OHT46845.1 hypothetical protein BHE19_04900 [Flavobacterium tructae]OXB21152.1 hypothetical protein B0A71_06080 [Flavobacterium tructae]OXB23567.1 hypothetical protein B0A80_10070 [Flavobacterium tructae]
MREIEQLYHNNFGIAFYWKKENETITDKVQLVFKETGFYFTVQELNYFCDLIEDSMIENACCEACELKNSCHKFLLKTPCAAIDLAVSIKELKSIKDLVEGSLFRIELDEYVYGVGLN